MEEARYWMWTKRKNSLSSHVLAPSINLSSSYGDSWEEQAFAEDAAGPLGGCIWPPRSYTCSFCRKEFRSAQALGGHMNVHRRDRARLRQLSPCPNNQISSPTKTSLGIQYPSQIRTLVYNQNSHRGFLGSPSSTSRVSLPILQVIDCHEKSAISSSPPFSSPIFFQEEQKRASVLSPPLKSNLVADGYCYNISDEEKEEKNFNFLEPKYRTKRDYVTADLSVSLNFVACRNDQSITASSDEDDNMSCKRRRIDDDATVSFFPKQSLVVRNIVNDSQSDVVEVSPTSDEDLDLELRLGDHRSA